MDWQARCETLETENDLLRERVRQLEAEVAAGRRIRIPVEFRLTGSEASVLTALYERAECTKQQIMNALYSTQTDDEPEIKIVDVFVCKMRRKLKAFGVEITTLWGKGYALGAAAKARLEELARAGHA